ncbi:ABC transporter ATP-binding protein [Thioalkalivibrio sp. AKL7]|uniref:ABC transporter ATP-binding protein n=1 Tax=Thioalkalivibrio sp. AKL7 TaxID=1158155 RepID=UPI00037BF215|nr:ATP-binding cassette domain-containing protein [Thioalkalivibrio sp. AKL7]
MGAAISIDYITHHYPGQEAPTLKDIQVTVAPGETVALIGQSGCGKSTLLHMLAGLLLPSEGCVRINGHQVIKPSPRWNMMFQKPSLYPWMTVRKNASLGLIFQGRKTDMRERIDQLLETVGLSEKAEVNVQSLSGGQQQRVALARSLATDPELLLLDEPFSALDAFTRVALQDEVTRLARERGISVVFVTHDIEEAVAMADRVLVMGSNPGTITAELPIDIAHPRDRNSQAFVDRKAELMGYFGATRTPAADKGSAEAEAPTPDTGSEQDESSSSESRARVRAA